MANRYWVGGTGNWLDNTNHWSATSNGAPGASLPTSADNVYFDQYSFTATGQTVTMNTGGNCLSMDWTGVLNTPTFGGNYSFTIYGSLTYCPNMILATGGGLYLRGTGNITTAGLLITSNFLNNAGTPNYTLLDDVTITHASGWTWSLGSLNTNGKKITTPAFVCNGASTRSLTLGASEIACSGNVTFTSTGLTFNAGTSLIKLTGNSKTFAGGGCTFNNVEFTGTPTTITGSNTFNDLKLTAGKTVNFTAGTTQTVTTLSGAGASGSLITIQSATAGTPFTISKASGSVTVDYWSIKDCTATGGATFNATNSTNVSGNTGWTFGGAWTCPNLKPRIDGAIKSMVGGNVRIEGALKTIDSMWTRIDGALKKL